MKEMLVVLAWLDSLVMTEFYPAQLVSAGQVVVEERLCV